MKSQLAFLLFLSFFVWDAASQSPHVTGGRYYWEWVVACSEWAVETQDRYVCTVEGKIECREGWDWNMCAGPMCAYLETPETFCNKPKCSEGCDPINGHCDIPNTCYCLNGYEGENCTEMMSHPFCKNGVAFSEAEPCVCFKSEEGKPLWTGDLCEIPVCKEGCSKKHGYCNEPNQCLCELGWKGDYCKTCAPYPGCQHGDCKKPWECNCYEGWQGTYCNETIGADKGKDWKPIVKKKEKKKEATVTDEKKNNKDENDKETVKNDKDGNKNEKKDAVDKADKKDKKNKTTGEEKEKKDKTEKKD